jgi:hypothetical protein
MMLTPGIHRHAHQAGDPHHRDDQANDDYEMRILNGTSPRVSRGIGL